ncbi:unnamed protein product [Didymodactylos carnosus]|uniref:Uncharacterized protein n=1 Tax=Didymodactylos carnosus TaxID=1234261 RepID=A0A814V183_9BILA|nr:unnamed protein product [Didymodactylos carnosus]CAF3945508.1 unnamed protein product [Didymodactylos carnosus]
MSPVYHQLCLSEFVQPNWVNSGGINWIRSGDDISAQADFRWWASAVFKMLSMFCEFSQQAIGIGLADFYSTTYLTPKLQSIPIFESETNENINLFIAMTRNTFQRSMNIIRNLTQSDAIQSGLLTNYYLLIDSFTDNGITKISIDSYNQHYGTCSCRKLPTCTSPATIYNISGTQMANVIFQPRGLLVGCYVLEALLQSNLACMYDQLCVNTLQSYISTINTRALNTSAFSRYHPNSTLNEILALLMVEDWNSNVSFPSYYKQCAPQECTYTYSAQNNVVYIVTTIIGLLGGLTKVLQVIIPSIVKFVREKKRPIEEVADNNFGKVYQKVKQYVKTFNIIKSYPPPTDPHGIRNQLISTRLFVVCLLALLFVLTVYTALIDVTVTQTVALPSLEQYEKLYENYPLALSCQCKTISVDYSEIMSFDPTFHQYCTSDFVSENWINYSNSHGHVLFNTYDYRWTGPVFFQFLRGLCQLSHVMINDDLAVFNSSQYITATVQLKHLFNDQTQSLIDNFILTTTQTFLQSMNIVKYINDANLLVSGLGTNFYLGFSPRGKVFWNSTQFYSDFPGNNCSCFYSNDCLMPSAVYNGSVYNLTEVFVMPGIELGCLISSSTIQSNLECFYNQSCIDISKTFMQSIYSLNVTAMNSSASSRYHPNSTLNEILALLMVEDWNSNASFPSYYKQCAPQECTYTYSAQNSVVYIATTIIGLLGGLTKVLQVIIPSIVKFVREKKRPIEEVAAYQIENFIGGDGEKLKKRFPPLSATA